MPSTLAPLFDALVVQQDDPDFEGTRPTGLAGVRVFRCARPLPRQPLVYEPGLVIVGQGRKLGHLKGRQFVYDASSYLILTVPLPFECETFASPEAPLMGLFIDIDAQRIRSLLDEVDKTTIPSVKRDDMPRGVEPARLDDEMVDAVSRLLRCLCYSDDRRVLGAGLVNEVVYRALRGPHGAALVSLAEQQSAFARVAQALAFVHENYHQSIAVEELARISAMSMSTFFRAFKEVAGDTPLGYIKKIRLDRARALLLQGPLAVSDVAYEVGYESPAQFSREFKRHFSTTPSALRKLELSAR